MNELIIKREAVVDVKSVTVNMSQPILQIRYVITDKESGKQVGETLETEFNPSKAFLAMLKNECLSRLTDKE